MSETYRILMVAPTSFFLDYGCHVRILEEVRVLQRLGHHVTVITYFLGRDIPDIEIVRTRPTPWRSDYEVGSSLHKIAFDVFLGWTGLKLALRRRFDIVHGHLHEGALIGYVLSRLQRIPLVADFQGSMTSEMVDHHFLDAEGPWYRWLRLLELRIAQLPDVVVTSTQLSAHVVERDFHCDGRVVNPLPDCVNLSFFDPDVLTPEEVAERRTALGIPAGCPVVVYLGLLADYQGTPLLIQAAQILKQRGIDAHFLIMGFPGVETHRRLAADLDVADRVTLTGKVPYEQAPAHLALGNVAVAPKLSHTEGAGKILNYMAMALPTVAFDTPVSREYLGPLGVYAGHTGDPVALADAIASLLLDPARRVALGSALRARAAQHFSWGRFGMKLQTIYQTALRQQTQSHRRLDPR
ncbi:MAG: glycosyltransferase family 4 protein [Anaerolineales bacterium]|nr:glycosyltransferase family 4 protein [Anaerolineales bacterium]